MKSFADWADEIRALMNPPAPMADTCNLSAVDLGTAIHNDWLRRGVIKDTHGLKPTQLDPKWLEWADTRAVEFRKELLGEFKLDNAFYDADKVKWDPAEPGADTTGTAMAQRQREKMDRLGLMYGSGRRTGKSRLQNEWYKRAMDFLASQDYSKLEERVIANGQVLWGITDEASSVVIYDEYTTFDPELFGTIKIDGKVK